MLPPTCSINSPNGVWFVELASLINPELIPQTILSAFGIGDQPGLTSLQLLGDYLHEKHLLLVLDNCEHLITETAKLVTSLLTRAENLKILATSREALGVEGEVNWYVPSLSLPDIKHLPTIEGLSQYEAVSLFIDRAILAQPYFTVTKGNAPAIAQICYRLDGIPLAIELAAARVKVLDVEQINKRLDNLFGLLTGGVRTALPRHQTLRATIDWSYELISDQEKILFRRLAVFAGGWTVEAAEQICRLEESEMDVLDLLAHLVDKSLVVMDNSAGEARYHMLETTRQYASEKLAVSGEMVETQDCHRDWYLELAESNVNERWGPNHLYWLNMLDNELDNLRASLEWSFGAGKSGMKGVRLVNALAEFWEDRAYFNEVFSWVEKAEEESRTQAGTPVRAKALYYYGRYINILFGDWKKAQPIWEESLETFHDLGEAHKFDRAITQLLLGLYLYFRNNEHEKGYAYMQEANHIFQNASYKPRYAWTLGALYDVKLYEGDINTAIALEEEALTIYNSCGCRFWAANCASNIGVCYLRQGAYPEAIKYCGDALEVFREFGNKVEIANALVRLGEAYRGLDKNDKAEACYRECLAIVQEVGLYSKIFISDYLNLGYTVLCRGDDKQAVSFFNEALRLSKQWDDRESLVLCVAGFAAVAVVRGDAEASALLYGTVDSEVKQLLTDGEKLNSLIPPVDRRELDRYQTLCRSKLGNSAYESAFARGRTLTLDAAITFALEKVVNQ